MRLSGIALMICLGATGCGKSNGPLGELANTPEGPAKVATPADTAEPDTGPVVEQLRKRYAERLAGLYYEPEQRRIVVRLTGATPVAPERHTLAGGSVQVVFEPGATHSLADLNRILADGTARIAAALPTAHGRYVDERTGAIVIAVAPDATAGEAKEAELTQSLGVPVRIETEAPAVPQRQPAQW